MAVSNNDYKEYVATFVIFCALAFGVWLYLQPSRIQQAANSIANHAEEVVNDNANRCRLIDQRSSVSDGLRCLSVTRCSDALKLSNAYLDFSDYRIESPMLVINGHVLNTALRDEGGGNGSWAECVMRLTSKSDAHSYAYATFRFQRISR